MQPRKMSPAPIFWTSPRLSWRRRDAKQEAQMGSVENMMPASVAGRNSMTLVSPQRTPPVVIRPIQRSQRHSLGDTAAVKVCMEPSRSPLWVTASQPSMEAARTRSCQAVRGMTQFENRSMWYSIRANMIPKPMAVPRHHRSPWFTSAPPPPAASSPSPGAPPPTSRTNVPMRHSARAPQVRNPTVRPPVDPESPNMDAKGVTTMNRAQMKAPFPAEVCESPIACEMYPAEHQRPISAPARATGTSQGVHKAKGRKARRKRTAATELSA
mmetsp:Transcript_19189/g.55786  ORF Transcript_19189/g.55786 Transcript_19189/m.55786 type:complete len:269 (+) Transcript_19189:839-1645(+)